MKKHNIILAVAVILLIALEQGIKIIVNRFFLEANTPLIASFVFFRPLFNRDYSWINSMLQLGLGRTVHIAIVILVIIIVLAGYIYIKNRFGSSFLINAAFVLLLSGGVCSLIDKVFWNGSLDYILLRGFFTFDLKDVYINAALGLIILMFIIDHRGLRTKI